MKMVIAVDGALLEKFSIFLDSEKIALEIVHPDIAGISIVSADGRLESGAEKIFAGGWVKCETARSLADKLGISRREMGKILDFLNVKVRECELGCF